VARTLCFDVNKRRLEGNLQLAVELANIHRSQDDNNGGRVEIIPKALN
jgi:hypothetical protein